MLHTPSSDETPAGSMSPPPFFVWGSVKPTGLPTPTVDSVAGTSVTSATTGRNQSLNSRVIIKNYMNDPWNDESVIFTLTVNRTRCLTLSLIVKYSLLFTLLLCAIAVGNCPIWDPKYTHHSLRRDFPVQCFDHKYVSLIMHLFRGMPSLMNKDHSSKVSHTSSSLMPFTSVMMDAPQQFQPKMNKAKELEIDEYIKLDESSLNQNLNCELYYQFHSAYQDIDNGDDTGGSGGISDAKKGKFVDWRQPFIYDVDWSAARSHFLQSVPSMSKNKNDPSLESTPFQFKVVFQPVLLLSQHRGGSKHLIEVLMEQMSQITADYELSSRFWYYHCSSVSLSANCNVQTLIWTIEQSYQLLRSKYIRWFFNQSNVFTEEDNDKEFMDGIKLFTFQKDTDQLIYESSVSNEQSDNSDTNRRVIGVQRTHYLIFKQQLFDMNPSFFRPLFEYFRCNQIKVMNLQRLSAVSAIWNLQADTFERLHSSTNTGIITKRDWKDKKHYLLVQSMPLPIRLTVDVVLLSEMNRRYLNRMSHLVSSMKVINGQSLNNLRLDYLNLYYEELVSHKYSDLYYQMIEQFIGLPLGTINPNGGQAFRQHPQPCFKKVSNWDELSPFLRTSDSSYACQKV